MNGDGQGWIVLFVFILLFCLPIFFLLIAIRSCPEKYLPNVLDEDNSFWIILISLSVWVYFNIFSISDLIFTSFNRVLITWIVVLISTSLTVFFIDDTKERPVWSVTNWPYIAILIGFGAGMIVFLYYVTLECNLDRPIFSNLLIICFSFFAALIIGVLVTITSFIILLAQFGFSISTLFLAILVPIYKYIDTGIIDFFAYFHLIFLYMIETFKYGEHISIMYAMSIVLAFLVKLFELDFRKIIPLK